MNYLASDLVTPDLSFHHYKKFMHEMEKFFLDKLYLHQGCAYRIVLQYVPEIEMLSILEARHSSPMGKTIVVSGMRIRSCCVGTNGKQLTKKLTIFGKSCDRCKQDGGISKR